MFGYSAMSCASSNISYDLGAIFNDCRFHGGCLTSQLDPLVKGRKREEGRRSIYQNRQLVSATLVLS
jgi:hypothetical protein